MSTETIDVATTVGTVQVAAEVVAEYLAVHESIHGLRLQPWQVTHKPTGKRVPGSFWLRESAIRYAETLAALNVDWASQNPATPDGLHALLTTAQDTDRKAWCSSPLPEWPTTEAEATADTMARYFAMTTQAAHLHQQEVLAKWVKPGEPSYEQNVSDAVNGSAVYVHEWSTLYLLALLTWRR